MIYYHEIFVTLHRYTPYMVEPEYLYENGIGSYCNDSYVDFYLLCIL